MGIHWFFFLLGVSTLLPAHAWLPDHSGRQQHRRSQAKRQLLQQLSHQHPHLTPQRRGMTALSSVSDPAEATFTDELYDDIRVAVQVVAKRAQVFHAIAAHPPQT